MVALVMVNRRRLGSGSSPLGRRDARTSRGWPLRLVKAGAVEMTCKPSKGRIKFLRILGIRETAPQGNAMFRPRQALLFPKEVLQLFFRTTLNCDKHVGNMQHANEKFNLEASQNGLTDKRHVTVGRARSELMAAGNASPNKAPTIL
jgi:hypothetical protein